MNTKSLVIAVDGPDGVGKSTQIKLLAKHFKKNNITLEATRHSGSTPISEKIRQISLSNTPRDPEIDVYFSLAMAVALSKLIKDSRDKNQVLLIDRSQLSMYAYNIVASQLKDKQLGLDAFDKMTSMYKLDLIIYLDAPKKTTEKRLAKRSERLDYFESQGNNFYERVRTGYMQALSRLKDKDPSCNLIVVDASGPINDVHNKIKQSIKKML